MNASRQRLGAFSPRYARVAAELRGVLLILLCVALACVALALSSCSGAPSVQVRDSVDEYSWEELSALSDEIAAAADDTAAMGIAQRYHLANGGGKLDGSQAKKLQLADGTVTSVVVAGLRHDDLPGGGKAGITFIFADAVAEHAMNNNAGFDERSESDGYDAEGGWNASEMRAWLNGEFVDELPADLQACLTDVAKQSVAIPEFLIANVDDNSMAEFSDESLMSAGVDKLWLPCVNEVGDPSEDSEAVEERSEWTPVLQREGERYQLFADAESADALNALRMRKLVGQGDDAPACRWWLRSVEDMTFADVRKDGSLDRMQDVLAAHPLGVVPCFAV